MSQVKFAPRELYLDNKLKELRSQRARSAGSSTCKQAVPSVLSQTSTSRGLPTREAAHRRNKKLLADLQITEARLRSLARYGPANAILEAERGRFISEQSTESTNITSCSKPT